MAASTVFWIGNAAAVAEVVSIDVTAVATGGKLTATINTKSVTYVCLSSDSTTTAAAAWQALLSACQFPEFAELTWTVSGNVVQATANVPGTPFYSSAYGWGLSASFSGGATGFLSVQQPNVSPSDVLDPNNWLRNGVKAIPVVGDNVVLQDSSVPLLWNIDQMPVVGSWTRWQSFTGTVGLPENNPLGYYEYRPSYLVFGGAGSSSSSSASAGPASPITVILGQGTTGSGPTRERYNAQGNQVTWTIRGAGSPADDYAVRILGTNTNSTLALVATSVGVAMLPGETAGLLSATVDGGGSLDLGPNVTVGSSLALFGASADVYCAVPSINAQQGSQLTVLSTGQTYPVITCITGSNILWDSNSNISVLTLQNNSTLDASGDVRTFTITSHTIDGDTCQINDPNNRIAYTNAGVVNQRVTSGPYIVGSGRSFKVV